MGGKRHFMFPWDAFRLVTWGWKAWHLITIPMSHSVSGFVNLSGAIPWSVAAHLSGEPSWLAAACLALEFRYQASCGLGGALFCFAFLDLLLSKTILSAGFPDSFQGDFFYYLFLIGTSFPQIRCQNLILLMKAMIPPQSLCSISHHGEPRCLQPSRKVFSLLF